MIAFFHTAAAHVQTFDRLLNDLDPGTRRSHSVHPELLSLARERGTDDPIVLGRTRDTLAQIALETSATVILCTCSTVGAAAEDAPVGPRTVVLRVDRPMAEAAVSRAAKIAIVAVLPSTIEPTRRLLEEVAFAHRHDVELLAVTCDDAWTLFEHGDLDRYHAVVARHADAILPAVDVVVLAQASMAPAAALTSAPGRVLSSPSLGVAAAYARLAEHL